MKSMELLLVITLAAIHAAFFTLPRNVEDAGVFSTAPQPARGPTGESTNSTAMRPNPQYRNDAVLQVDLMIFILSLSRMHKRLKVIEASGT